MDMVFEHDIYVDLPDVLDGKPDYANAPLPKFFARACVDRPEVLDRKPGYANSPLPKFFVRARCLLILALSSVAAVNMAERRGVFKHNISYSSFSSNFSSSFSSYFFCFLESVGYGCLDVFVMGLSWFLGRICFCFV